MHKAKHASPSSLITPPAEDSADEGEDDQEPKVFNFTGPQSDEEVRDRALQEASLYGRSLSLDSPQDGASRQPISFNFGPQPAEAPEAEYIASFAKGLGKNQMCLGIRELAASINKKRRAAANREFRGCATAYIDEDESGTYDPKKARRTPPPISRSVKRVKISNAVDEYGNLKPRSLARQIGFQYSLVVKLEFNSKKALSYLRSLPAGVSGPQPSHGFEEVDSDDSGSAQTKKKREVRRPRRLGTMVSRPDGLTIDGLTSGHPQRRGCVCCFQQSNDDCSLIEDPDEYPCEACEDAGVDCVFILPPTFKKACLRCKEKRRNCSYILDGGKGANSCDACDEGGVTCCAEPLTEPSMVRRFAHLPARVKSKSITAGNELLKDRMYVACNQCRSGGKRCNNRGKSDPGPCSNCRKANQACKFVDPNPITAKPQMPDSQSLKNKKTFASSSRHYSESESSTPPRDRMGTHQSPGTLTQTLYSELEKKNTRQANKLIAQGKLLSPSHPLYKSLFGSRGKSSSNFLQTSPKQIGHTLGVTHTHIATSFCHPITFNYIPDPLLRNPCSWCDNPFFGLWGLASTSGPRKVEGFYYSDGHGFEEIHGGFSDLGYSRSVMCIACTYARVRITQCPSHRLRTLDPNKGEIDMRVFDDGLWSDAVESYKSGDDAGTELVRSAKWCSVCPTAAVLRCCSPQLFDEDGEPVPQAGHENARDAADGGCDGCGLLLCEDCAELMAKVLRGGTRIGSKQLDAIFKEVTRNQWRYTDGVRADAEFLTSSGELLRRMNQGMGASEGKLDDEGEMRMLKMRGESGWIGGGFDGSEGDGEKENQGKGKGKQKADVVDKAWMQYQAREETSRSSMAAYSRGKGKMLSNGLGGGGGGAPGDGRDTIRSKNAMSASSSSSGVQNSQRTRTSERRPSSRSNKTQTPKRENFTTSSQSYTAFNNNNNSHISGHGAHGGASASDVDQGVERSSIGNRNGTASRGIKRERDTRGENQFGGLLREGKKDVEKATRGQMEFIDLTEDED